MSTSPANSAKSGNEPRPTTPTGSIDSAQDAASELAGLTLEEQELQRAEWNQELSCVEEEIATLRTVLGSKVRRSSELKRKLGITVWKEISEDMSSGIRNVKGSDVYQGMQHKATELSQAMQSTTAYQKTESAFKTTAEKTSSLFGGLTSKISQMKNSESFKSFEEKVGATFENVKTKVSTSRSGSVHSFENYHEGSRPGTTVNTAPQSPTIPEEKALK